MSQSAQQGGTANSKELEHLEEYLNDIVDLSSKLMDIYRFEEKAEISVRDKFNHYKEDADDLEQYEEELEKIIQHIQQFENSARANPIKFVADLSKYLHSISLHQIGEKGVRPQHLFIKEAQLYSEQGKTGTAIKLKNEAFETLEILERMNKIILTLLQEGEYSQKAKGRPGNIAEALERYESIAQETIEDLEMEKTRTENRYKQLIGNSKF